MNKPIRKLNATVRIGALCLIVNCTLCAAETANISERIDPQGIPGKLVICGGGTLDEEIIQRFVKLAGGEEGKLVVIPTASATASTDEPEKFTASWKKYSLASVTLLHAKTREEANQSDFAKPIHDATAVWFGGGDQTRIADRYLGTPVESALSDLLARGGVIGGTSAGAAIMSRRMIAGGNPDPRIAIGFDLLPDAVVDQHFLQRNRKPRLLRCLADQPTNFGIGIDESTAVIIDGRRMQVFGDGKVTICLPPSPKRTARDYELDKGDSADLTALRRAVRARHDGSWPPAEITASGIRSGSLILGGGGRLSDVVPKKFVELAGGPERLIVILPTAAEEPNPTGMSERRMFERIGAKNIAVLAGHKRSEVESEEFLETIERASGIWFGGGRQWRFVDAYEGTRAVAAFHELLRRGGVIGGSSAGASIQAEYMVRGSPLGNMEMMSEGYERGFGFLPGTAVDQHFSQRRRQPDMESFIKAYPQFLGIGIDEATALLVRGTEAQVIGANSIRFFDHKAMQAHGGKPIDVAAGKSFDLVRRSIMSDGPSAVEDKQRVE
jgi:cyanophycinase